MIQRLHHTGLVVRDLNEAVTFYRDVVGLDVLSEYERQGEGVDQVIGYQNAHLRATTLGFRDDHILELIQYVHPRSAARPTEERSVLGAAHLAFQVDDIQATFEELSAGGRSDDESTGRAGAREDGVLFPGSRRQLARASRVEPISRSLPRDNRPVHRRAVGSPSAREHTPEGG